MQQVTAALPSSDRAAVLFEAHQRRIYERTDRMFAGLMALADQGKGSPHGFANPVFYANAAAFYDVLSVKTAVARRNFVNNVDATAGTVDRLRTFDDYSGSPTQHTGPGWDNVTGLGTPSGAFLTTFGT